MAWKQTRGFDLNKAGKANGWCLQNVRLGYSIAAKYSNAITAWKNTQQHKNRNIPTGVAVPLYYTYKTDGHINVRLPDGRIWNDGTIFKDLATYLSLRPQVSYLGWGESINDVRVIQEVANTPSLPAPTGGSFRVKPGHTFRVYKPGTATVAGRIDNSWGWYQKRGLDPKFPNRWIMNSAALGLVSFPFANIKGQRYVGEFEEK